MSALPVLLLPAFCVYSAVLYFSRLILPKPDTGVSPIAHSLAVLAFYLCLLIFIFTAYGRDKGKRAFSYLWGDFVD
ncbi:MAG: hypothetical protein DU429_03190 [Candidatus Tokpelaia sp.]|nr:MAG: hypothetical protein DU430_01050 [Candidatus Tokpelaia sp.]KAA6207127.1 MAG: hypothetical protein DU429_03190 [Candidatus Tokpelaia sp.]KAA6405982.1 hypothetical protein DPQ22_02230 [Candidatus Tokpelaia sp.]